MRKHRIDKRLAALLVLPILSLVSGATPATSAAGRPELPQLKVTRYLSPFGTQSTLLSCYPETDSGTEFYCDIVREKNGTVAATVGIKGPEVDDLMRQFFSTMPRTVPSVPGDTVLGWEIRYGAHESHGTVPRFEHDKTSGAKSALLQLEAALSAQFYR